MKITIEILLVTRFRKKFPRFLAQAPCRILYENTDKKIIVCANIPV